MATMMPEFPGTEFSETYAQARSLFLRAASARSARTVSFRNPNGTGPDGEPLHTDVAVLGPERPARLLLVVSGTHGIEGFTGSAIQSGLLRGGFAEDSPAGLGVVMVHALNPWGFAYQRRVNEDNVDVNRNFIDHSRVPENKNYEDVHEALVEPAWDEARSNELLMEYGGRRGMRALQAAVTGGQWTRPDGLFYGGNRPVWSHQTLRAIVREFAAGVPRVAYVDLHTGLGKRGWGEPIFRGGTDAGARDRAHAWYGDDLTMSEDGTSSSTPINGNTATCVASLLDEDQRLTAITLEFGTLGGIEVLGALRADNWLHLGAGLADSRAKQVKQAIRDAFYPDEPEWRDTVWKRAITVLGQALRGLSREEASND
jgi:hypothetical protein